MNPASHGHRDYRHPPDRKSMHARIVRDFGMRIVAGEFAPGDRLPTEAALLADYDVSRPVLREAVRVLVAKGLVLSRQRAGATVRPRKDNKQTILSTFGRPAAQVRYASVDGDVWVYRYKEQNVWDSVMSVEFDRNGVVQAMVNGPDPEREGRRGR